MNASIPIVRTNLSLAFLFSGLALMIFIYTGLHLFSALLLLFAPALIVSYVGFKSLEKRQRRELASDLKTGLIIGVAGTIVYDTLRLSLYATHAINFFPFETFNLFGKALIGSSTPYNFAFAVGACYHLLNGVTFSIAYRISFRDKKYGWAIAYAMGLEILMLLTYSNWLNLDGKMNDFFIVSLVGHFSYGATVGILNQYKFNSHHYEMGNQKEFKS